ncbi:MAG: hypothetical protein DWQ43_05515 [Acidobacteria bacterium]|nr:MAG: hypothetical protein DWQ43_05515 [Acidobacteriota bacterium]
MFKNFRFISVALLALMLSAFAFGQGTTGEIEGTVTDSTGAVVPGASVRIESTGSTAGFRRTVTTDDNGFFIVSNLAPGAYKVTVENSGFDAFTKTVTVSVDRAVPVNARLVPAGTTAEVDVDTSGAVTIDPTDTKIDTNITKDVIEALPRGTNFTNLLKIAPNVRPESNAGGFQIDGASGSENVFVIDGQEVTNFASGTLDNNNNLPFELLQEVQIKSTGFEAEYGGATGGVINAVTAGGNNDWHGNFGISFRPEGFQGKPNVVLNAYGTAPGEFDYFQPNKDGGTDFFPVGSISGPVLKDRVWFKVDYAPQIFEGSRTVDYYDTDSPSRTIQETHTFDAKTTRQYAFARVDAQPISSLRVFGTFLWNPIIADGLFPSSTEGLSVSSPNITPAQYALRGGRQNSNAYNAQATWTPLNWVVLNFRHGESFQNEKIGSYGITAGQRFAISTGSPINPCDASAFNWPGTVEYCRGFNTGANNVLVFDVSTRTTYDADASFVGINAGGRHNIKVGWQRNQLYNNVDDGYTSSGYTLLYFGGALINYTGLQGLPLCDFQNINPNDTTCSLGAARLVRIGTAGEASSDNDGIFVQDSWQIANRFTANIGIRFENELVPSFGDPDTTTDIKFGWGDKIAPRLGFAYDLTGDGKTKVFASYGWFYDRFKYELPRGLFGAEVWIDNWGDTTPARGISPFNYTLQAMIGNRPIMFGGECPTANPQGWAICERDNRVPSNSVGANPFEGAGAVDPDLKAMRQSEFTIGFERELGNNFLFKARFTHKQLDQAIEDIGAFNSEGSEAYVIGNPGQGLACEVAQSGGFPCTKAERKYDAVELTVDKRGTAFGSNNYFFNATYTWSRLFGNYSGLASSDELGRTSPNVNRFFDLPMLGWTAGGEPDNGLLGTDRTHVFKAYGGYTFDWNDNGVNATTVSAFTTAQSGVPLTTVYSLYNVSTSILFERGDLGRSEMFTETDLFVSHKYKFGRDNRVTFEPYIEIRNLFDERNELGISRSYGTTNIVGTSLEAGGCTTCVVRNSSGTVLVGPTEGASLREIFSGGIRQYVINYFNANPQLLSNTYGESNSFQGGRDVRFGFRFVF